VARIWDEETHGRFVCKPEEKTLLVSPGHREDYNIENNRK
jgi:hypothetical protein